VGQGTVFRVSPTQFERLLASTSPVGTTVKRVEKALGVVWPVQPKNGTGTFDSEEFDRAVQALLKAGINEKPPGRRKPDAVLGAGRMQFARDPKVKAWVLLEADGTCELCGAAAPFVTAKGLPFLEGHHVRQLANKGSDTTENSVALCPNCHRRLHHGAKAAQDVERLYRKVGRLVRE